MTGLRTRAVRTIGRSSVGVLSVAALLLTAPLAGATPESDAADEAITAAWQADGGAAGELGDKDGDVYQVGAGFGQNFADGKIYFTPATGAHFVTGAVLDKYSALGGPADSDLGFPTADEAAGKVEGSRDSTFSAADDPVIFWTPDDGAWVVRGAINVAWDKLGGSAGTLGVPTADETWKGSVVSQSFTGGEISWDATSKTFTTTPPELAGQLAGLQVPGDATTAIDAARRAAGGPLGPLGAEEGAQYKVGDKGVGQNYAGGAIFYSPDTGANAVTGALLAKYRTAGGPLGDLGLPVSTESDGALPKSRVVVFGAADQPVIFSTPDHGTFIVRGAMNAAWAKLGGAAGKLGAPTADQKVTGDVISQQFAGGSISWNGASRAFTVDPSSLTGQLTGLQIPGLDLSKPPATSHGSDWYHFHWWWLLAIIPLVLAIGALAIAAVLRRRRRSERRAADDAPDSHEDFGADDDWQATDHYDDEYVGHDYFADDEGFEHAAGTGHEFQDDPDTVDTAPNAIVDPEVHDEPAPETQRSHAPGWAGLGASWGVTGLGATGTAPDQAPEPDSQSADADPDDEDEADDRVEALDDDVDHEPERDEDEPVDGSVEEEPVSGPPSGRHHAAHLDEPETAQMSFRVAIGDNAPEGYSIKADTKSGQYWVPGSPGYDAAPTEIWFASEDFAITNGFIRG